VIAGLLLGRGRPVAPVSRDRNELNSGRVVPK
jgi:hypothetical protein